VRQLVGAVSPAVLALELPPLAVGLFARLAMTDTGPPQKGGEMSAAIRAAADSHVVGIDAPSWQFLTAVATALRRGDTDVASAPGLLRRLVDISGHAVACRLNEFAAKLSLPTPDVVTPLAHQCPRDASPTAQARHEAEHLSRTRSLFAAVERPAAQRQFAALREATMCRRLEAVAQRGPVVAIVGFDHLEAIADTLCSQSATA
jgi:pheromone shutdown protein TraB